MLRHMRLALFASALLAFGTLTPVARAAEPLPDCRIDDVLTVHAATSEWRRSVLDTIYMLPDTYAPPVLVSTSRARLNGGYLIRKRVIPDLRALGDAARTAGVGLMVRSAYRSYRRQQTVFQSEVDAYGYETAITQSARPGHSEHQLGTTVDFQGVSDTVAPWNHDDWGATPAGQWMRENAWKYGWLMSYPGGRESTTCYAYEPWHYRYVGRDVAAAVQASGLTVREYLWMHQGH
jgi:D-alanyl-D-alanine carboxypeptidase